MIELRTSERTEKQADAIRLAVDALRESLDEVGRAQRSLDRLLSHLSSRTTLKAAATQFWGSVVAAVLASVLTAVFMRACK